MQVEKNVPNQTFIDTLFVVALINPRDQYHAKAAELAASYENSRLLTGAVRQIDKWHVQRENRHERSINALKHSQGLFDFNRSDLTHSRRFQITSLYKSISDQQDHRDWICWRFTKPRRYESGRCTNQR